MTSHQANAGPGTGGLSDATLADIGTVAWRLRQKLGQHPEVGRPISRQVEELWDTLKRAGLDVRDHTDQSLPSGGAYGLRVLAYQPTAGLKVEVVLETIKPSVFYQGRLLQMGQVIVGVPPADHSGDQPSREEREE